MHNSFSLMNLSFVSVERAQFRRHQSGMKWICRQKQVLLEPSDRCTTRRARTIKAIKAADEAALAATRCTARCC
jgi:hypothetical protein